ncbi:hypothetical protein [Roseibium sediminis]|uniref:hypothetical protein n=1 Tax=Roseibium sediminis TaxID=1775174 RepID=UPI00123C91BE|nr:hypothetical protein [Roseibium sediminis]
MQHVGDIEVLSERILDDQLTGSAFVRAGGHLIVNGQICRDLVVDEGGTAVVNGQVCGDLRNNGTVKINGRCAAD